MAEVVQIVVNGNPRDVAEGSTVADLLGTLEINERHVAVEVNQELVPRTLHRDRRLASGDRLEIVTLVGGG